MDIGKTIISEYNQMWEKQRMKKYRYLKKMIFIIMFSVFIPVICVFCFFWMRAKKELSAGNDVYSEKIVESFASDFVQKVEEMKMHAARIVVDSKESNSSFWLGLELFQENPYYYYDGVKTMKDEYIYYGAGACGIYYYDIDCVMTKEGTTKADFFLKTLQFDKVKTDFFNRNLYQAEHWIYDSVCDEKQDRRYMLLGYCAQLGKNRDKVLIFYVIGEKDYGNILTEVYGKTGIYFYIMDEVNKKVFLEIGNKTENKIATYCKQSSVFPFDFYVDITESSLQNNVIKFYHDIRNLFVAVCFVLLLICSITLYVLYKPIYKLTKTLKLKQKGEDEFDLIYSALGERDEQLSEQGMMIIDLLIKHLVHGVPVSREMLQKLGISPEINRYCVFVLKGHILLASVIEKITSEIENRCGGKLYCTDWFGEKKSVLILFMESSDIEMVEDILRACLSSFLEKPYSLRRGCIVDDVNSIRDSFLSCLKEDDRRIHGEEDIQALRLAEDKRDKIIEDVLNYIKKNFRDVSLNQVKVADEFGISVYSLSRLFNKQVGVGFVEYINSLRLEYAKELLLTSSISIREIYYEAGFASEASFYRNFKSKVGIAPAEFRE